MPAARAKNEMARSISSNSVNVGEEEHSENSNSSKRK
jgi:hypothetical protein